MTKKQNHTLIKAIKEEDGFVMYPDWDTAIDVVDYPVWQVPAYFYVENEDTYYEAVGESSGGRDKQFHFIVVDKFRNGVLSAIAPVTDKYGTVKTKTVYKELKEQLAEGKIKHDLVYVWVSGNGGRQVLSVSLPDLTDTSGVPDTLQMNLHVITSVDGTSAHTLRTVVKNKNSDSTYFVKGADMKLSARHTRTIKDRSVHFIPMIEKMIEKWNDEIMPVMALMFDNKFEREFALELIEDICKKAKIGEKHMVNIRNLYVSTGVNTNASDDSLYRVNHVFSEYLDKEVSGKPELVERFKENIAKQISIQVEKLKKAK